MSKEQALQQARRLLAQQRWAGLATVGGDNCPNASMVAYVVSDDMRQVLLHLSTLAEHTRNLQQQPQASLVVSEPDPGHGDPQQLARASLSGRIQPLPATDASYPQARAAYLERLPDAVQLFEFGDFQLFTLQVEKLRFVGGFGRAFSWGREQLGAAATD